jgi:hypothetical protein
MAHLYLGEKIKALCMSYIDTIDHELVGIFAGLPVYHPLETLSGNEPTSGDFNCTPAHLVLGGGSGEHPAVVLQRPDVAVASFIQTWRDHAPAAQPTRDAVSLHADVAAWEPFLEEMYAIPEHEIWHFAGWSVPTYASFYSLCQSETLWHPYDATQSETFEHWLTASFGEFVFFALSELCPNNATHLPRAKEVIQDALYVNVLVPPPGYRLPYGRRLQNGQIRWGNLRWP